MTKQKSTKRALLMSGLALLMCVSMLIGSTFAWFTDSVTSAGNKIQAGTLDIELWKVDSSMAETEQVKNEALFNYDLWEPGYAYATDLKLKNVGTLDAKFIMTIVPTEAVGELAEVIDVYYTINDFYAWKMATQWSDPSVLRENVKEEFVKLGTLKDVLNGTVKFPETAITAKSEVFIQIAMVMQESAGNEYQGKSAGVFDLRILATQLASEYDSFDNQYDKFADYDGEISNATSLAAALANGGTYKVISNVTLDSTVTVAEGVTVNLDLGGNTISAANTGAPAIENNGKLTITGGELANTISETKGSHTIKNNAGATLIIEDGKIGNAENAGAAVYNNGGYVEINGGTFASKQENVKSDGKSAYAFINYSGTMIINDATVTEPTHGLFAAYGGTLTVNGGDYTLKDEDGTSGLACYMTYTTGEGRIILNDGSFNIVNTRSNRYMFHYDGTANKNYFASAVTDGGYVTMNGGTYNFDVTDYAADGYGVTQNADGTWTVAYIPAVSVNGKEYDSFADAMNTIQAGSTVTVELNKDAIDSKFAIPANANVTIDLNGNKLSYTKGSVTVTDNTGADKKVWSAIGISAGATLTIKDGDITYTTGDTGLISNYGTLNLEGGTYSVSDSSSSAPMVLMNKTGGVVNATGVTFENACKAVAIDNEGEMTLTNCVIKQTNASAIDGAAIDNNNKLTLVNCTVSNAKANYQLLGQHKTTAVTTIESGSYTSTGKIGVDSGSYIINGGTFNVSPSASNVTINGTLNQNPDGTWTVTAE